MRKLPTLAAVDSLTTKGLSAAQRVLGVSRRDLGRAAQIANICPEAQEEIRRAAG